MNTEIYVKAEYTELGIRKLQRIIYNPYRKSAKKVMQEWILSEFWDQCYGINKVIKK